MMSRYYVRALRAMKSQPDKSPLPKDSAAGVLGRWR